jgi:hypothetical protein
MELVLFLDNEPHMKREKLKPVLLKEVHERDGKNEGPHNGVPIFLKYVMMQLGHNK